MKKPYRTSFAVLAAIFAAGLAMQFAFGALNIRALAWPVSPIVAALVVIAVAGITLYREKPLFRLLAGVPFSVSLMGAMLMCFLVMGLVPQHGMPPRGLLTRAGIYAVASSWPFVLLYLTLLISLGCLVAGAVLDSGVRRWGFLLNHLGLWLVLLGAGLGAADRRDLRVKINVGETEMSAADRASGVPAAMPFAIRLDGFRMEEYPVRWGLVDVRTNRFQPEKRPVFHETEAEAFAANPSPGAHERIASTVPEPSYFASDITIFTPHGEQRAAVEVNRPHRRGNWAVYQYGYDSMAGKDSQYSVLQLVRDPWLPVVYAGIAMLAAGAFSLFGFNKRRRNGLE